LQMPDLAAHPDYASNAARNAARDRLRCLIEDCFARLDAATVAKRLEQARIAHARVNDLADLWDHPQLRARKRWSEVETEHGPVPALQPPGSPTDAAPRMDAVPALGQHTDAILAELGQTQAQVDALRLAGAI
jgi:itaconate CoA-transferase